MISMSKRHHIVEDDEGSSAITRYYLRSLEPYELNEREQTAALMTIKGCTQKEIASFLNVSESTVKLALRSLYDKLHVKGKREFLDKFALY